MSMLEALARFVHGASYDTLSSGAVQQLKIRLIDALGCAVGAMTAPPVRAIHGMLRELESGGHAVLIGGGTAAPDRAAFYNGALIRYLDFNDSYLAKGETCHPSDNIGAIMAAAEIADASGRDLLTAIAVSYQVQCRLSDEAPVRAKGFDHTTQGVYGAAAGVAKALRLTTDDIANALAISGTAYNALRVTRTGSLSHWKGLAAPNAAMGATFSAFLAKAGITGPAELFEGNKGFMESIAGPFTLDWDQEDLERVRQTILKKYNAEVHSQSALECLLELRETHHLTADAIAHVEVEIFDVAYHIIGGGEEGAKTQVRTKEEADHSLPYMLAVALLDGQVTPAQYAPERIARADVQHLMSHIDIHPSPAFSERFPREMPCRLTLHLKNNERITLEKSDYEGFFTRPMSVDTVVRKFNTLYAYGAKPDPECQSRLVDTILRLEDFSARDLVQGLRNIRRKEPVSTVQPR